MYAVQFALSVLRRVMRMRDRRGSRRTMDNLRDTRGRRACRCSGCRHRGAVGTFTVWWDQTLRRKGQCRPIECHASCPGTQCTVLARLLDVYSAAPFPVTVAVVAVATKARAPPVNHAVRARSAQRYGWCESVELDIRARAQTGQAMRREAAGP